MENKIISTFESKWRTLLPLPYLKKKMWIFYFSDDFRIGIKLSNCIETGKNFWNRPITNIHILQIGLKWRRPCSHKVYKTTKPIVKIHICCWISTYHVLYMNVLSNKLFFFLIFDYYYYWEYEAKEKLD